MARGISAVIFLVSLIFSMSMLGGLGYYADMGVAYDVEGQNEDVQAAADALEGIGYDEDRSGSILQGPLAAVIPFGDHLQMFTTILGNTSGVIQLLFGVPETIADPIQTMFRLAMFITFIFGIRGILQ